VDVSDRAWVRLARSWRWLGPGPLVVLLALDLAGVALSGPVADALLLAGGLAVGLPHGGVDWAALPLARDGRLSVGGLAVVGILYAGLGSAALAAWWLAPVPTAVGFLLLTAYHWGQGDRYVLHRKYAPHPPGPAQQALVVVVRGGIPMVVPLLTHPVAYRRVLESFARPFGGQVALSWMFAAEFRLGLGIVLLATTLSSLVVGYRLAGATPAWRWDVLETALLWVAFLVLPPVAAIGVYFATWHAWRHVGRVLLLDGPSETALAAGDWLRPMLRFGAAAAVPSVLAMAFAGSLWLFVPARPTTLAGVSGLGLVAIAVLTLPHVAVVTWLDRLASGRTTTARGAGR
jgi:Brp/Blh family beta-carotene 15,15'-monooxygenase